MPLKTSHHPFGSADIAPVVRNTLHEQAYATLRHLLMSGHLQPGAELSLRSMAARLGTSEMPVRDAVRRLIAENALRSLPSRKVVVPTMTAAEFRELLVIRKLLEGEAARSAASRVGQDGLECLRALHRQMTSAATGDDAAYLELNKAFHFTIYQACGLPLLIAMIETLWLRIGPIFTRIAVHIARDGANEYHQHAIDALARGDGAGAASAICSDLDAVGSVIVRVLDDGLDKPAR